MKKLLYSIFLAGLALTACDDNDLPRANYEQYQVENIAAASGDGYVVLKWVNQANVPAPIEYYVTWTTSNPDVEGGEMIVEPTVNEVTIPNLVNGCAYTFGVQARYPKGLSMKLTANCTPKSTRIAPSNFKVMAGDKRAYAVWTAPETNLDYTYLLEVNNNGKQEQKINIPSAETSCLVENLTNGTEYSFSLSCVYAHGNSPAISAMATPGDIDAITTSSKQLRLYELGIFEYNPAYFVSGEVASVSWDFGDGAVSKETIGMHKYAVTGEYTVTITITYENGNTESGITTINVVPFTWGSIAGVGYQKSSPLVFSPDGQTFYTAPQTDKKLIAVDAINGEIRWEYVTTGATYGAGPAVGPDGTIYIGTEDSTGPFYAISPTGTLRWQMTMGTAIKAAPAVTSDGTVYVLVDGGILRAIDATTGSEKWKATESGNAAGVAVDKDGTVYMATSDGVWAYSSNGNKKWASSEGLKCTERGGSIAIGEGMVYVTLKGKNGCAAINSSNGNVEWKYATSLGDCYHPVVDKEGTVYFCEKAGGLYAVTKAGSLKWSDNSVVNYIYNGFAIAEDGRAIISQYASPFDLLSFDQNGQKEVLINIGAQTMSPVTLGPDNRIYYSTNGSISTMEINSSIASQGWPMRGGNQQGSNSLK